MNCPECKVEVEVLSGDEGTNSYCPVDRSLRTMVDDNKLPFYCTMCGAFKFPYQPIRDIVMLWPDPVPDKIGSLYVPEIAKEALKTEYGTILAVGKGYYDKKGKFHPTEVKPGQRVAYDKDCPWRQPVIGFDGKEYIVTLLGERDVKGIVE